MCAYMLSRKIKNSIDKVVKELGLEVGQYVVEHPENMDHGDFTCNVALGQKNPKELANKIVEQLHESDLKKIASEISVAGSGFINISIQKDVLGKQTERVLKGGIEKSFQGKKYLVEHTSPNPNKAMHLGHLRNNVTGMAIANLFEFLGGKVVRDCVDNNRGIAIAKLMWGYLKFGRLDKKERIDLDYWYEHQDEWQTPESAGVRPDRFVDELYVKGAEDCKDKEVEKQVRQLVVDWEKKDKKNRALWEKVLEYSYQGQALTLKRLNNQWDKVWHEHEHYQAGKDLVKKGLAKKVFKKGKKGAIVTDLKKYGIADTVVIKGDGTALYITQDLALTKLKRETFKPDKLFWVIGPEQSLALKQMFAACEQLGIVKVNDCTHVSYGWMSLKGLGRMSSRTGKVVYIDDLLDMAKEGVKKISDEVDDEKAEEIGVGAVKYSILKVGRQKDTAFDMDESVSLEGNSGPYLQYTFARCQSVLAKGKKINKERFLVYLSGEEDKLLRTLCRFEEVIVEAAEELAPNLVCNFLYDLAQKYNSFYNKHRILTADTKEQKQTRLWLTKATGEIVKQGLGVLGIAAPKQM